MKFLFAWRYFKSKKTTNVINVISWISVLAIAVGTAALIVVLSVFNGFEGLVKSLYSDFYADMRVAPGKSKFMKITDAQFAAIKKTAGVRDASLVVEEKAVLVNGDYNSIVYLRGVDGNYANVVNLGKHIVNGKYILGSVDKPALILGGGVDNALAANPASPEPMTIYLPNTEADNFSDLQNAMNSFNIAYAGTFRVQEDFDNKYGFTNLPFVQYMMELPNDTYSSVDIAIKPRANPQTVQNALQQELGNGYSVLTRYQQNQGLFSVMQMEKWVIYVILSLILLIAAFNMIGALTMLVLEKQKDIAVLKAMGANNQLIQGIFLSEGIFLAVFGGILGVLLALVICYVQMTWHVVPLQGGSFLIDYYPVELHVDDFILVTFTILFVAIVASWIPAKKAATQFISLKS